MDRVLPGFGDNYVYIGGFCLVLLPLAEEAYKKTKQERGPTRDQMGAQKEEEDEYDEDADEDVEKGIKDKELNRPRDPTLTDCGILF